MNLPANKPLQHSLRILLCAVIYVSACMIECKDSSAQKTQATPPHVIVVAIDGLAIGQLGCYDSETSATPNIDQLAAEGLKFNRAYRDSDPKDLLSLNKSETTVATLVESFEDHLGREDNVSSPFIGLLNLSMPSQQLDDLSTIDRQVGQLMSAINKSTASQNTLVIFCSTFSAQQQGVYEDGLRVPVIARWPNNIEAGGQSDLLIGLGDIRATIDELTSDSEVDATDSISLVPTLFGSNDLQLQHEWMLWQWTSEGAKRQAIRSGGWKLLRNSVAKPWELYHLKSDPAETENLASERTNLVARMEQLFVAKASKQSTQTAQQTFRQRLLKPADSLQPLTIGGVISDSKPEFKGVAFDKDAVLMGAVSGLDSDGALHLNMVWDLQTGRRPVRFIHLCDADGQIVSQVKANDELFRETETRKQILDYVQIPSEQMQQARSVKIGFYEAQRKNAVVADGSGLKKWRFDIWTAE